LFQDEKEQKKTLLFRLHSPCKQTRIYWVNSFRFTVQK